MSNRYQIDKPYPQPMGLAANRSTGLTLLKCYCGQRSELTSMTQYMYLSMKCAAEQPPLSELLRTLAEVEMKHLFMLGSCINALGVNPKLRTLSDRRKSYWTGRNISYVESHREILRAGIENERAQILLYVSLTKQISNTQVNSLLERIVEDERLHESVLSEFYNKYY
jgi:bacterioferritin